MKPNQAPSHVEQLMMMQEQVATAVASLTGVKAQFIKAGWSAPNAELATIELLRQGASGK
ncbi:hypothetical protein SAMN04489740_2701 [Arthrobacter alpinus]|uniref:Uncharacterized protein n=1 Tax=Arthrobacter alpinus TaxID=656366 RepID=A0A1H5M0T5_9MICC|nr:hypothetical protein [Arthrobacter alpinus]SEE82939.1 hypothetical protein SAMN04489740_2701 [Arthrobacter alpinus]